MDFSQPPNNLPREAEHLLHAVAGISNPKASAVICRNFVLLVDELFRQKESGDSATVRAAMDVKASKAKDIYFYRPLHTSQVIAPHGMQRKADEEMDVSDLKSVLIAFYQASGLDETSGLAETLANVLNWLNCSRGTIEIPIHRGRLVPDAITVKEYIA